MEKLLSAFFPLCFPGTLVTVVTATDADRPNTTHTKISYSIMKQEPSDGTRHFGIDRQTGRIYLRENTLDREVRQIMDPHIICLTATSICL